MKLIDRSPEDLNELFKSVIERDLEGLGLPGFLGRWLFAERLKAQGVRGEMSFDAFEGVAHISKFFAPQLTDRTEIHGLPRIWRKVDPTLFL